MSLPEVAGPMSEEVNRSPALDQGISVHPVSIPRRQPGRLLPTPREPSPLSRQRGIWFWRTVAALLILGSAGLHLTYLTTDNPLDLAPDEAHYWDWSRHLDWSYYSKGPLVAYLIRGSCELFGDMAVSATGDLMPAVRLPAVLCGSLLLLALYILTVQVHGRESLAALVVLLALTLPLLAAGSTLMTIDAPYTCLWAWALVLGHRAIFRGSMAAWWLLGFVVGLGILAKYTMILWFPSVGLFLLTSPRYRPLLFQRGFWIMTGIAALCCLPIFVWNMTHGWVSVRHVNGLAGASDSGIKWLGPVVYLGTQCGLLMVFWFVVWLAAMIAHRPTVEMNPHLRYLWWLSALTFAVFLMFSPKTGGGEANWPAAAYLSGLVLAVGWITRQLQTPHPWLFRWNCGSLAVTCLLGVSVSGLMHCSEYLYPLLAAVAGPPTRERPFPLRQCDPTCRLRGWRTLAAEVDRIRAELKAEGVDPILAGTLWNLPGELGFYCEGHPTVYSIGLALRDRRSQYDFWRPNPVWDAEQFLGRTFVVVGVFTPEAKDAFDEVGPERVVFHYEGDQPVNAWGVRICRGFKGFRPVSELLSKQRF